MPSPAQALPAQEVPAAAGDEEAIMEEEAEEVISPDGMEVLQQLMGRQLSVGQQFTHYDFTECYHHVTSVTEWFSDGFCRVINEFHVPSMFKDNFYVTPSKNGTFFHLQTRISPTLLNAADRAEQEFDPSNRVTSTILSSIRQTVNVIANALGTDFDNQWSEGNEYALPFVCNPLRTWELSGSTATSNCWNTERHAQDPTHQKLCTSRFPSSGSSYRARKRSA